MANTMTLISSVTVGAGGASSIDFTSIPATYTDLCLKFSGRTGSGTPNSDSTIQFNGDTGSNYNEKVIYGTGSTVSSLSGTAGAIDVRPNGGSSTANTFANIEFYIPNYAGSNQKSFSFDIAVENNATATFTSLQAALWTNTAAITSIKLNAASYGNTFAQYSTAYLYGIKNS